MLKGSKADKSGVIEHKNAKGDVVYTEEGLCIGTGTSKRVVTAEQVTQMAYAHCTLGEMADICGVKPDTLKRFFAETIAKGRAQAKNDLRRAQWKLALGGNATMQIWLGKNILGQSDNPLDTDSSKILPWTDSVDDKLGDIEDGL